MGQTASVNGVELYYEIEGRGEPLVLLHGFTGLGSDWKLTFKEPPAGLSAIMPDLRIRLRP